MRIESLSNRKIGHQSFLPGAEYLFSKSQWLVCVQWSLSFHWIWELHQWKFCTALLLYTKTCTARFTKTCSSAFCCAISTVVASSIFGSPFNSRVRLTLSIVGENRIVFKQKDWSPIVFAQGWISFLKVPMAGVCTMEFEFPLNMGTASMKVLYRIASIYENVYRKVYENVLVGFLLCNFNSGCFFNFRKSIQFSGSINFVHRWWESKSTSSPGLFARSWRLFAMSFETFSLVGSFKVIRSFAVYLSDDCHCSFNNGWQVLPRQFSVNL